MPDVYSVQNYYAFGQSMPNWSSTASVNDPKKYRFGYNGKEDDDEWGKQDYGFRIYDGRIGRFLSVDPLSRDYPELTPYQFASNTPIMAIDLDGLEAKIVFDKYYNSLHIIPDLSKTNPDLPYKYVTAVEYSNLTDDERARHNYGIEVQNVFTGGHFDSEKKVIIYKDPERPAEKPISVGTYSILENKGNTEPSHDSFFVLDPVDSAPYDKIDDRPGETNYKGEKRSGYNLHPGKVSHGCVTICKADSKLTTDERAKEWEIINDVIEQTKKELVPDNRGSYKYVPGKQAKFGTLEVIDSTPPPPPPVKKETKPKDKPATPTTTPDRA
jgi:RHS repeat-associated protein